LPAGNRDTGIYHLGLDICFDEYNYHDSLRARYIQGIDHYNSPLEAGVIELSSKLVKLTREQLKGRHFVLMKD